MDAKTCQRPFKFDLEVKSQCLIGIMNVRDILSYGHVPNMVSQCQTKTKLWAGHESVRQTDRQTDRQMDRQTDGQSDSYIPPELRS